MKSLIRYYTIYNMYTCFNYNINEMVHLLWLVFTLEWNNLVLSHVQVVSCNKVLIHLAFIYTLVTLTWYFMGEEGQTNILIRFRCYRLQPVLDGPENIHRTN